MEDYINNVYGWYYDEPLLYPGLGLPATQFDMQFPSTTHVLSSSHVDVRIIQIPSLSIPPHT